MPDFKEITLADKSWMTELFRKGNLNSEEYNFTFCFIWREAFGYKAARFGDYVVVSSEKEGTASYLFPAGSGDVAPVIEALRERAKRRGERLEFHCVLALHKALLETMYPNEFTFKELTDYYDYVYDAESLISLSGKKLHSKRNHINRFKENNPNWRFESITPENIGEVIVMSKKWCEINGCYDDKSLRSEACSVENALGNFFSLDVSGGLIRADSEVIAFTVGERLNSDTFLVHIEKAFGDIQGAYTIINQEFAAANCEGYLYINREDDSGSEGLRKAKLSYRPAFMVEKFEVGSVK